MSEISQIERVPDEELDQMIWKLERDGGMTPKMLSLMKELREVRRAKGEPVAYMIGGHYLMHAHDPKVDNYASAEPLYVTPPAPAVPDAVEIAIENLKQKLVDCNRYNYCSDAVKSVESACRAAMLNAEKLNQPVSETETLPSEYLQGHQDGLEWAAQMAEANHPQTGDWLYDDPIALAAAIRKGPDMPLASGNSPVTPDSWKEEAEKLAESYGAAFVIFRHGEEPVCADPTKFWFGFDPAAPKEAE